MPARVPFEELKLLGPIDVLRWKSSHDEIPSELTAEEWHLPDGADLLELSIKVDRKDGFRARDEFVTFLTGIGHRPQRGAGSEDPHRLGMPGPSAAPLSVHRMAP